MNFAIATPPGYEPQAERGGEGHAVRRRNRAAKFPSLTIHREAVAGAQAMYTDVWASMGQEAEAAERRKLFLPCQVNDSLMAQARGRSRVHALPAGANAAKRWPTTVIESSQSVVFDQAENRLHAQKALLLMLLA